MYEFIDVTQTQEDVSEGTLLPSEAMKINGEYIENLIPEYRTLTVEGREALSREIETYEVGSRNGSEMKGARYPARTIRVTYQLRCASNEDFRAAYNKLAGILSVENAELIFEDEPDKYFIGTPSYVGEVEPGRNSVIGEFEIVCLDPFKYSVMEYEATANEGESSILIDYKGSFESYPKLSAEFFKENEASEDGKSSQVLHGNGDCGYVAFFNDKEKIIQLGDPDETDLDTSAYPKSQTLISQDFNYAKCWGSGDKLWWSENTGAIVPDSRIALKNGTLSGGVATHQADGTDAKQTKTATILTARSTAERPFIDYDVSATVSNRRETYAQLTITVTASLDNRDSYFSNRGVLKCDITFGSTTKTITIKAATEKMYGTTKVKKSVTFTPTIDKDTSTISGIKFKAYRTDNNGQTGVLSERTCAPLVFFPYIAPSEATYYVHPTNYGSGSGWHGASITRAIPEDKAGEIGAKNFKLTYSNKMAAAGNATNQIGDFQALAVSNINGERSVIAGIHISKSATGKVAKVSLYVNGLMKKSFDIGLGEDNVYFAYGRTSTITKIGNSIHFSIGNGKQQYEFKDNAITDSVVNEITFNFMKYGDKPELKYNGLYSVKFVKNNCTTWADVPNKFSANDIVEADCKTGDILLNGTNTPSLGALGNDWESFYLKPGLNQIGVSYSEWVNELYAPTFKVKYREVYL